MRTLAVVMNPTSNWLSKMKMISVIAINGKKTKKEKKTAMHEIGRLTTAKEKERNMGFDNFSNYLYKSLQFLEIEESL
ncbi:hypothetical protein Scep_014839 [Stephania cephalantha]|uniref:Uncharacterized protein n=1 Tax=Stephania cephalantha TaxID=152367 RepID=A0AAP0P0T4_9MAGN